MLNPPKYIYRNNKPEIGNLVEISSHLVVVIRDPKTEVGKVMGCVTAIDFKNKTVTYMNTENEEKTEAGDILLFVDRDKISQHKEPETQNSKTGKFMKNAETAGATP